MGRVLCIECGQRPPGMMRDGKLIKGNDLDYCPQCQSSVNPNNPNKRSRWTKRKPEIIEKNPIEFESDKIRLKGGETPTDVDPIYNRRNPYFSRQ